MGILAVYVLAYFVTTACVLSESGPRTGGEPTGRCGGCRYELAGLPLGSPCPECGSFKLERTPEKPTVDPARRARWWPTLFVFLAILLFCYPLAEGVLVLRYLRDHFSLQTALTSIPVRELSGNALDGDLGPGGVLFPLLASIALTPLTSLIKSWRKTMLWFAGVIIAGLAATIALWTLPPGYR